MHNSLHILWVTERFPPHGGGMAESAGRQVAGLRNQSHRVDVVHFVQQEGPIGLKRLPKDNGTNYTISYPDAIANAVQRAWREIELQHQQTPFDLVIGFGCNHPGHIATSWAAWLGLPSVVLIRGNDFDRDWFDPRRHSLVESALQRASAVGAVSQEKAHKVRALFPGKTTQWTPNGIDAEQWDLLPADRAVSEKVRHDLNKENRRVIGLIGELKFKKRIPLWLEAIRDAHLIEQIGLLVIGRMDEELDALLKDPQLSPIYQHWSFRSPEQLPALYHACDFVAIPSLIEGFPNVLLEAMACGVIPICSTAGAMGEVVVDGKTGFVFDVEDRAGASDATARALRLADDEFLAMKQRVRECVVEQFSCHCEREELLTLIHTAMGRTTAVQTITG